MTNSKTFHKILNLRCSSHTKYALSKEVHAYDYHVKIYSRVVQHILKMDRWSLEQHDLQQATMTPALTAETVNSSEHDEATLSILSARSLHCRACEEAKSTGAEPLSASYENRELWSAVRCYLTEENYTVYEKRKAHLWIYVDEATKLTVGHVLKEGRQVGNIDVRRVLELLQERWIAVFGRMPTLRTDPDGAWRNKEANERLSDMQIILDIHQGETSWQVSVMENTSGIETDTMTRIALKRPNLKSSEVLAAAVLDHNEMERLRGLSTTQWTLGNSTNLDQLFFDSGNETTDRDAWLKVHTDELFKR